MDRTEETNSLEVRWFGGGAPPRALDEWVAGLGTVETSTRTDPYLSPVDPSLNVKLRGGGGESVEIKRRIGGPERRSFGPGVAGDVEQWYKWRFPLDRAPTLRAVDRTGLWLPVEKTRTLYAFEDGEIRSLADVSGPATAEVEVTAVTALTETAWTCCLEVSGRSDELRDCFAAVGADLFGAGFPVELGSRDSFGYAEWLRQVAIDPGPSSDVLALPDG